MVWYNHSSKLMIAFPFRSRLVFLFLSLVTLTTLGTNSSEATNSGLPLPRFVTLADVQVNARAGPGFRFPINWVYLRKGLPVEVIGEFGHWRRTRDVDGVEGWIHLSMLSGKRAVIVNATSADPSPLMLRRSPNNQSVPRAIIQAGAHGRLLECERDWCRIEFSPYRGWLPRRVLWGVYEHEQID